MALLRSVVCFYYYYYYRMCAVNSLIIHISLHSLTVSRGTRQILNRSNQVSFSVFAPTVNIVHTYI